MPLYLLIPNSKPQDAYIAQRDDVLPGIDLRHDVIVMVLSHPLPLWIVGLRDGGDNRKIQLHDSEQSAEEYQIALSKYYIPRCIFLKRLDCDDSKAA